MKRRKIVEEKNIWSLEWKKNGEGKGGKYFVRGKPAQIAELPHSEFDQKLFSHFNILRQNVTKMENERRKISVGGKGGK